MPVLFSPVKAKPAVDEPPSEEGGDKGDDDDIQEVIEDVDEEQEASCDDLNESFMFVCPQCWSEAGLDTCMCDKCKRWFHYKCMDSKMTKKRFELIGSLTCVKLQCPGCQSSCEDIDEAEKTWAQLVEDDDFSQTQSVDPVAVANLVQLDKSVDTDKASSGTVNCVWCCELCLVLWMKLAVGV